MFTVPQSPCLYGTAPVSSCAHYFGSWLDWSDWSPLTRFYSPEQAYGNSEVAQVLSSPHLTRMMEAQGQGVKVYSCTASTLVLSTQNSGHLGLRPASRESQACGCEQFCWEEREPGEDVGRHLQTARYPELWTALKNLL